MADEKFSSQMKSKFRPNAEWFASMQNQFSDDIMQSDQPADESESFPDFLIDNPVDNSQPPVETEVKEVKHPRYVPKQPVIFQNLCSSHNRTVHASDFDSEYDYEPKTYQEIRCTYPYHSSRFDHSKNRVCHAVHNFNCVQLHASIILLKR
jgi:hypothetical protein